MLNNLILLALILMAVYLAYGDRIPFLQRQKEDKRLKFLNRLADFLDAPLTPIQGLPEGYQIAFTRKGDAFVFESIPEEGFGRVEFIGRLKHRLPQSFSLGFTEKSGRVRSEVKQISDTASPWRANIGKVMMPKELAEFECHTSHPSAANFLLNEESVVKILAKYKNLDVRGHPLISFEILNGLMVLKFHPPGDLNPNLFDLNHDVAKIEDYINQFKVLINRLLEFDWESSTASPA